MSEQTTDIVDYEKLMEDMAKASAKLERPSVSTIKTRSGILQYNGQPCPGNKLPCIIIASTHLNAYYEDKFDPDDPKSPVCFAFSPDPETVPMKPHPKSEKPQCETCDDCPMNKWKSDPDGGKGKACKNSRKLALIPSGTTTEDMPTAEIAVLALPVTSTGAWGNYVNKLATLFKRPPLGMKTIVGVEPHIKHQYHLTFQEDGPVEKELLMPLMEKAKLAQDLLEIPYEPNGKTAEPAESGESKGKAKKF